MTAAYPLEHVSLDIIYIEDNPGDQQLFKEQLSLSDDYRFQVRVAENLKDAYPLYQDYPADLLLLDLNLSDTKDRDTIDLAVRNFPGVPILILSQSKNLDISFYASSQGIVDFLMKDEALKTEKLVRAILMAKLRWEVEQQRVGLVMNNLEESLGMLRGVRQQLNHHINVFSHRIRGPLCTLEGLMNLLDHDLDGEERERILSGLRVTYRRLKVEVDDTIKTLESQAQQQ